jgi:S-adenosylmethionine hydrolase
LASSLHYFPNGTTHVVVVDPGVGSDRSILYVEAAGQRMLATDNGCLTGVLKKLCTPQVIRRVDNPHWWRENVSTTFHVRDIFASVAGHLSLGLASEEIGTKVDSWVQLELPLPKKTKNGLVGEVVFIDVFGNLITNIEAGEISNPLAVSRIGKKRIKKVRWVRTYAEAKPKELVLLIGSENYLEIAVVQGNPAKKLKAKAGEKVVVGW